MKIEHLTIDQKLNDPDFERYSTLIDKSVRDADDCLICPFMPAKVGPLSLRAAVLKYEHGVTFEGRTNVQSTCGKPGCVNPEHLYSYQELTITGEDAVRLRVANMKLAELEAALEMQYEEIKSLRETA